jgi:hypothetical protein
MNSTSTGLGDTSFERTFMEAALLRVGEAEEALEKGDLEKAREILEGAKSTFLIDGEYLCVFIHAYIHTYIRTYAQVRTYIQIIHTHAQVYVCPYVHTQLYSEYTN